VDNIAQEYKNTSGIRYSRFAKDTFEKASVGATTTNGRNFQQKISVPERKYLLQSGEQHIINVIHNLST